MSRKQNVDNKNLKSIRKSTLSLMQWHFFQSEIIYKKHADYKEQKLGNHLKLYQSKDPQSSIKWLQIIITNWDFLLGSKTLGTKCIRTSMCNVLANYDQNLEFRFRLVKVCLFVKLESSELQDLLAKSARLYRSNFV